VRKRKLCIILHLY